MSSRMKGNLIYILTNCQLYIKMNDKYIHVYYIYLIIIYRLYSHIWIVTKTPNHDHE